MGCAGIGAFAFRSTRRAWHATVELHPSQLISRGAFRTRVYPAAEIAGFEVMRSGFGSAARVVLIGRGSRGLAVGAGYGDYAEQVVSTLRGWLSLIAARRTMTGRSLAARPAADQTIRTPIAFPATVF